MKSSLTIYIILFSFFNLNAQTTAIPDSVFEQKLIDLGLDIGPTDGLILTSSIDTVTRLKIVSSQINSLTGIEGFTSLAHLEIFTDITRLDISKNLSLTFLLCRAQLDSLDVSNNVYLTELMCPDNEILFLDLSNNTKLELLHCWGNNLTTIDLSNNPELIEVKCANNSINDIIIPNLPKLRILDCGENDLSTLNISKTINVEEIACYLNNITALDLSVNTKLKRLEFSFNQISNIDLSNNTDLVYLGCSSNEIDSLDISLQTNLENLQCAYNRLENLDVSNADKLVSLDCQNNRLISLNLKNDNNTEFNIIYARNNNLTCVMVDSPQYSNENWNTSNYSFDNNVSFSVNCEVTSLTQVIDKSSNVLFFPNPTKGDINISVPHQAIQIFNLKGELLMNLKDNRNSVNVSFLQEGIYILKITNKEQIYCKKLIKN